MKLDWITTNLNELSCFEDCNEDFSFRIELQLPWTEYHQIWSSSAMTTTRWRASHQTRQTGFHTTLAPEWVTSLFLSKFYGYVRLFMFFGFKEETVWKNWDKLTQQTENLNALNWPNILMYVLQMWYWFLLSYCLNC